MFYLASSMSKRFSFGCPLKPGPAGSSPVILANLYVLPANPHA